MWKILNKLFGFDYVGWRNSADSGLSRVYRDENGAYYFRYRKISVIDRIVKKDQVTWLTCESDKYMKATKE